ncbi:class I SAM-dependent methyltransferase, partial [Mycobacteroides abscessus]|uniref:class I SAM-dependent methyltransferase n=1 Tax=Mycobacteroides abscessus TaxID=36809 RepID=UPI003744A479
PSITRLRHAGTVDQVSTRTPLCWTQPVIGEVPDKAACVRSLAQVLKPGGRLVFHEIFLDPDRLGISELRSLAEPAGFTFATATGSRWRDIVEFART